MAEEAGQHPEATERGLVEKIEEKFHSVVGGGDHHSSSSSDSEDERKAPSPQPLAAAAVAASSPPERKVFHLFGRDRPVHHVLGGGKPADVILWRDRKVSAGVLGFASAIWILFELLDYHLLTLLGHALIFTLAGLFLWSNASTFIHKSPPRIPEVSIPEDQTVALALRTRYDINRALALLHNIALGKDLKKFLGVIAGLWVLSVVGSWTDFLTLFCILFVLLHTVPVLYEKYEDKVDPFAEKALSEFNKHYATVQAKVIDKIPRGPLKHKKN